MLTHRERRVKDEKNGRVYDDLGRTVHQDGRSRGKTTCVIPGWQRPVLAFAAIGGGFVAVHLSPARGRSFGRAEDCHARLVATIDVRQAAEEAKRLAGEVAARRDPRADINEAKRRERAVVAAALDAYEKWTVAAACGRWTR